jgi:hypothetical protein
LCGVPYSWCLLVKIECNRLCMLVIGSSYANLIIKERVRGHFIL